jgi:TonB family protein
MLPEMEEVGSVATRGSRRWVVSGTVSTVVHAGLVVAAVLFASERGARTRQPVLTPIEFVEAPPPPPPPPPAAPVGTGTQVASLAGANAGTLGRHGRGAPRSMSRAPAAADPLADVVVSYDAPTSSEAGNEDGTVGHGIGSGLMGDGAGGGGGGFGLGNVPPAPSLAHPPRPKGNYRHWDFRAAPAFAGGLIRVELTIAPDGGVREVRLLKGVDSYVDRHAVERARGFQFYPALNDAGQPTWGRHGWEFVIGADGEMQ